MSDGTAPEKGDVSPRCWTCGRFSRICLGGRYVGYFVWRHGRTEHQMSTVR